MVSASHNPIEYNGIKFFDNKGFKLPDDVEVRVEELILTGKAEKLAVAPHRMGKAYRIDDAGGRYIQYLKGTFPSGLTLEGLRIVIDCANGAGYRVAPSVFRELGADLIPTCVSPNGFNINKDCGALHPERLSRLVRENKANMGIALDGDADRVILCDEKGSIVDGDAILAICAAHLRQKGNLAKNTVVGTHMSNMGLEVALKKIGINLVRTDVGDRYVMEVMRQHGYNLGGETCGHIIFLHHTTCGDGILAALRVLSVMLQRDRPLSEIASLFTAFPQVMKNVHVRKKCPFEEVPGLLQELSEVTRLLGEKGRHLLRYSGTENIARIMIEGEDVDMIEKLASNVARRIEQAIGEK